MLRMMCGVICISKLPTWSACYWSFRTLAYFRSLQNTLLKEYFDQRQRRRQDDEDKWYWGTHQILV